MQIQRKLGADIVFVFDQCLAIGADEETTKISLARTNDWEKRDLKEFTKLNKDGRQALYGIVQGGRFKESRGKKCQVRRFPSFSWYRHRRHFWRP